MGKLIAAWIGLVGFAGVAHADAEPATTSDRVAPADSRVTARHDAPAPVITRGALAVWSLHLSREPTWGGTEGAAATERFSLDLEGSSALTRWLSVQGKVSYADGGLTAECYVVFDLVAAKKD